MRPEGFQHIRIHIQAGQQVREVIDHDRDRRPVRDLLEELDNGLLGHGPVERRRNEDEGEVCAVLVADQRLLDDVAGAATQTADRDGEAVLSLCLGDLSCSSNQLGLFVLAEGARLAAGTRDDN